MEAIEDTRRFAWQWWVFILTFAAVLLKQAGGEGLLQQMEELALLAPDERGQTLGAEFGWPFPVLFTEAYTLRFHWLAQDETSLVLRALYICIDAAAMLVVPIIATSYLSFVIRATSWRLDIATLLAITAAFGIIVAWATRLFSYHGGVGALSFAVATYLDAFALLCIVLTCHWFVTRTGLLLRLICKYALT